MSRTNWKRVSPTSFRHAIELCKDYAKEIHNLSIERIADLMGEESHWTVYGWLRDGSIPGKKILAFQNVCRCDFITLWLAHSESKLLISIPAGRKVAAADINVLQDETTAAIAALIQFAQGKATENDTINSITRAMEGLAWHRENVTKANEPELELEAPHVL